MEGAWPMGLGSKTPPRMYIFFLVYYAFRIVPLISDLGVVIRWCIKQNKRCTAKKLDKDIGLKVVHISRQ